MTTPLARALALYRSEYFDNGLEALNQRAALLRDHPPALEDELIDYRRECLLLALLLELQGEHFPEDLDPVLHLGLRSITYPEEAAALVAPLHAALEHLPEPRRSALRTTLTHAAILAVLCGLPPWPFDVLVPLKLEAAKHLRAILDERLQGVPGTHLSEEDLFEVFGGGYWGDSTTSQAIPAFALILALHHLGDLQPHEPDPAWDCLLAVELPSCANAFYTFNLINNPAGDPVQQALLLLPEDRRTKLLCTLSSLDAWPWLLTNPTPEVSKHLAALFIGSADGQLEASCFVDPLLSPDTLRPFAPTLLDALIEQLPRVPTELLRAELPSALLALASPQHAHLLLSQALQRPPSTLRNLLLFAVARLPTDHLHPALPKHLLTPEHLPTLAELAAAVLWRRGDGALARDLLQHHSHDLTPEDAQRLRDALKDDLAALRPHAATFLEDLTRFQTHGSLNPNDAESSGEDEEAGFDDEEEGYGDEEEDYGDEEEDYGDEDEDDSQEHPLQGYTPPRDLLELHEALGRADHHTLVALSGDTYAWPATPFALWTRLLHTSEPRLDNQLHLHAALLLQGKETLQRVALLIAREAPAHPRLRLLYLWLTEQRPDDTDLHLLLLESSSLIVQEVALTALLKNADPEAPQRLVALLQHRRAHTRAAAARALEHRRDPGALPLLRAALAREKAKDPRDALQTAVAVLDPAVEDARSIAADAGTWEHLKDLNPQDLLLQLRDLLHAPPTGITFARAIDLVARLHLCGDATLGVHYLLGHGIQTWNYNQRFLPAGFRQAPDLRPLYDALYELHDPAATPGFIAPIALLHAPSSRALLQPHLDALDQGVLLRHFTPDLLDLFLRATLATWSWCKRHQLPLDTLQLRVDAGGWYESGDGFEEPTTALLILHNAFAAHLLRTDPFDWGHGHRISELRIEVPARHPVRSHIAMKPRQRILYIEPAWLGLDMTLPGALPLP